MVSHKVTTPITSDLMLAIYEDKVPIELKAREQNDLSALSAHLRDGNRNIFIRGYQTVRPVGIVFDSEITPRCQIGSFSRNLGSDTRPNYLINISGVNPLYQEQLKSQIGPQTSFFFASAHSIGIALFKEGILNSNGQTAFISRINDLVMGSPTLFCNASLTAHVSWDNEQYIGNKKSTFRNIDLRIAHEGDFASATIKLALVKM